MYSVKEFKQGEYTAYLLEDTEAGTAAVITPEKGGMITSITKGGEEFTWLRENNYELPERPRCAVPVLFPCCGRCADGVNTFDGKAYPMDIHGMAHSLPWEVVGTDTADGALITIRLTDSEKTHEFYPYEFEVDITYVLQGSAINVLQSYKNKGEKPMPFSFGFHPYFAISDVRNLKWDIEAQVVADPDTNTQQPFTGVGFPYDDDQTTRYYKGVKSPMTFTDEGNGHAVMVSFDEHFKNAVLWSQCQLGFVCMEPWNGWPNSLNTADHEVLQAGEEMDAAMSIQFENIK
ncbi:MAG: aldose epimerase [Ruminococcaceae bacterium]|nr:aldose epimerase [Oscillospiraceae bacterium]